jgi:TonB family protein
MPGFPGGDAALMKFIGDSIRYPKDAKEKGLQGKVVTRFIVKADGSVSEATIIKGISRSLDDEALRVIKSLPNFTPGELDGKKVAVSYMVPITFALN